MTVDRAPAPGLLIAIAWIAGLGTIGFLGLGLALFWGNSLEPINFEGGSGGVYVSPWRYVWAPVGGAGVCLMLLTASVSALRRWDRRTFRTRLAWLGLATLVAVGLAVGLAENDEAAHPHGIASTAQPGQSQPR